MEHTRTAKRAIYRRIKQFLASEDIEMVRLGATLLEKNFNKKKWEPTLRGFTSTRWRWSISKNAIRITELLIPGLWSQLNAGYRHAYKVYTGSGGLNMIKQAISEYYNKTQTNEQKKTTNKRQHFSKGSGGNKAKGYQLRARSKIFESSI